MIRSLILGSVAFAGVFVASQQFHIIKSDMDRYNAMAEMSGSPTLARKFGKILLESFGQLGGDRAEQTKSFLEGMVGDVIRYARIKGM
jgi:hypothetical protein